MQNVFLPLQLHINEANTATLVTCHYNEVTWAWLQGLKSLASTLIIQQLIQANNKENRKAMHCYWWILHTKSRKCRNVSMLWQHPKLVVKVTDLSPAIAMRTYCSDGLISAPFGADMSPSKQYVAKWPVSIRYWSTRVWPGSTQLSKLLEVAISSGAPYIFQTPWNKNVYWSCETIFIPAYDQKQLNFLVF